MDHDLEICYLGIETASPESLSSFFTDVIGLVPGTDTADGALTWRNDAKVHRLLVSEGPANDATFFGMEAADLGTFERLQRRLRDAGFLPVPASAETCAARRVEAMVTVMTPWGVRLELVLGLADGGPFESPLVAGGFLTGGVGFGHAVFATTAADTAHTFITEGLGMRQSDWVEFEPAPGIELRVNFYHCNERHHTLAIAAAPFDLPQTLHHVMFETRDRDDVGRAFDRAWNAGLTIANGLGRHDNDGMFSFYVTSPIGFQVEVGHGARLVTDDWADNRRYDRVSVWGHQPIVRS